MKTQPQISKFLITCAVLTAAASLQATTLTLNQSDPYQGFMNVFNKPQDGGGFVFNSSWGVADLTATYSGSVLTLGPNAINDTNSFWYTPSGGPGAVGNKTMDANYYVDTTGVYTGQTLTFTANVLSDTLLGETNQIGNGWTATAFIKDFAPDYSSFVGVTAPLVNGVFSISLNTINDPTRHIQYGFEVIGPDVWSTDVGNYGNIQLMAVPEPASIGPIMVGAAGVFAGFKRRK